MPMNQNYHNDDEFKKIIESLKSLPKVDAPQDFELNLKRKLNGLKYGDVKLENESASWFYRFAPGAALVLSAVAIVLVLTQNNPDQENPFMQMPAQRSGMVTGEVYSQNATNLLIDPDNVTANDVVIVKSVPKQIAKAEKSETAEVENSGRSRAVQQSVPQTNERRFAFRGYENDIDQSLRARPSNTPQGYSNYGNTVNFGGFNVVPEDEKRSLEDLKTRIDSIKKWMRENGR